MRYVLPVFTHSLDVEQDCLTHPPLGCTQRSACGDTPRKVRGRYLTMTGHRLGGNGSIADRTAELQHIHARLFPPKLAKPQSKPRASDAGSDDDLIARARSAQDGGKFARLWDGHWEGNYDSQSEADSALCMKLAFWTNRDAGRIDALFRRSGLMREKWNRKDYREVTIARAIEQTTETWKPRVARARVLAAQINIDTVTPTMELLNACEVFGGRIGFKAIKRRGPMIVADFGESNEAIWKTMTDLTSFARSQAILAEATQVLIPTPVRRDVKPLWEPAVQLILRLAGDDRITSTDALREEFREIIPDTWKKAGLPIAVDDPQFLAVLRECQSHVRDPKSIAPPRCCVWHDNQHCYVHQPSLIEWLGLPAGGNKRPDWGEVRNALLLLNFVPERVHRSVTDKSGKVAANVRLWRGPLDLLADDETVSSDD
jgi:hypothetical protein